ncbi:MAG: DUF2794 domain-containing protein [Pseudomonadota bacterium]
MAMGEGEEASQVVRLRPSAKDQARTPPSPTHSAPPAASSQITAQRPAPPLVAFHRTELAAILRIYGFMVAAGEWRDYAIDHGKDQAVFSIYRRMGEVPQYRVLKTPKLAQRQGAYAVENAQGMILKRGQDLEQVLRVLSKRRFLSLVE